ncbi:hypothetical protein AB0465_37370 [Streptomyces griseoviridis]|uniref:hypothetical protein n=1 Tax=Streptomyces griseoviridis TaxID=45398 RepID=UPI00344E251F
MSEGLTAVDDEQLFDLSAQEQRMTLSDDTPRRMRLTPFAPLPDDCARLSGGASGRTRSRPAPGAARRSRSPARTYARTPW